MVEHAERKKTEPQLILSSAEKNKEPQLIVSSEDEGRLISSEDETKLVIVEEEEEKIVEVEEEKIVEVMDEDVVEVIDNDDIKLDGGEKVVLVDHFKIHGEKDHDRIRNEEKDEDEKICPINEHSEEVDDDSLVVLSDRNDDVIKIDDSPQNDIVMIDEKQVDIIPLEEKVHILTVIEEEKSLKKLTAIDIDDEEISFSIERKIDNNTDIIDIDKSNNKDPLKELKMNGSSIKARSKRSRLRNGAVTEGEEVSTTEDETMKDKCYNASPGVAGRVKNRTKRRSTRKVNGGV